MFKLKKKKSIYFNFTDITSVTKQILSRLCRNTAHKPQATMAKQWPVKATLWEETWFKYL